MTWAWECERPACIPRVRSRGLAAKGISYERSLARALRTALPDVKHGQWYSYHADKRDGWCQVDFVRAGASPVYVFECKLTDVEKATEQLLDLYFPVLARAYHAVVRGIIVVKSIHRVPTCATVVTTLSDALRVSAERVPVLHWLGRGTL